MKKTVALVFLLSILLVAFTPGAQADNTACSGAVLMVPDGSPHEGTFTAPGQQRWYRFIAKENRSYAVMTENLSSTDEQFALSIAFDPTSSCNPNDTLLSTIGESTEPVALSFGSGSERFLIVVPFDTNVFFPLVGFSGGAFRVRVEETTLFNPLWSTFGGFETFYRFQNSTNASCDVTLRMVNDAGMQVANTTFPIPANSTVPTVFTGPTAQGGLNLADNQAGQAVITHDCPPGAIQVDGFTGRFDLAAPVVLPIKIQTARQMR